MIKQSGVYQIQSKIKPKRCYIGSGVNIVQRKSKHLRELKNNKHHSAKLQNHVNKYGIDDLDFSILEPCFPGGLIAKEQQYLDNLNPYFNICKKAGSVLGIKRTKEEIAKGAAKRRGRIVSAETRKKMSEAKIGKVGNRLGSTVSDETKQKLREINIGKKHTEEEKKFQSERQKGKKLSPATIAKIVAKTTGQKRTKEVRLKMSFAAKGRKLSEETKQRMSVAKKKQYKEHPMSLKTKHKIGQANKGRKPPQKSLELRAKMSASRMGFKYSKESKARMRESAIKREQLKRLKKQIISKEVSTCN